MNNNEDDIFAEQNPFRKLNKAAFNKTRQPVKPIVKKSEVKKDTSQADTAMFRSALGEKKQVDEDDEIQDFAAVMTNVKPLPGKERVVALKVEEKTESIFSPHVYEDNIIFSVNNSSEYAEGHVLGLDLLTVSKLQRGQPNSEAHLDLHGLTASQAYQSLVNFMRNAHYRNQRAVLIVTGRGLNSINGLSVLREKVQSWLVTDPFKRVVLAFCTAQPADGGAGALYVLLRKVGKNMPRIDWDIVPLDIDLID